MQLSSRHSFYINQLNNIFDILCNLCLNVVKYIESITSELTRTRNVIDTLDEGVGKSVISVYML